MQWTEWTDKDLDMKWICSYLVKLFKLFHPFVCIMLLCLLKYELVVSPCLGVRPFLPCVQSLNITQVLKCWFLL